MMMMLQAEQEQLGTVECTRVFACLWLWLVSPSAQLMKLLTIMEPKSRKVNYRKLKIRTMKPDSLPHSQYSECNLRAAGLPHLETNASLNFNMACLLIDCQAF